MADRDRFGGSDRDYAYTDYSGRRGLDVRNPGDHAIQRAHNYPSNRQPLLNQPPMERPSYDWPGQPSYGEWMQSIDPNREGQQRPHVNPRMRHINPRGMGGGLGALQQKSQLRRPKYFTNLDMLGRPDLSFRYSHIDPSKKGIGTGGSGEMSNRPDYFRDDESIRGTWRMMEDARRADEMDEYGYLEGAPRQRTTFTEGYIDPRSFDEMYGGVYDDAIFRTVDPNTDRIAGTETQVAYSPGDFSGPIRRPRIKPLTIEEEELDLLDILEGLDPGDELDPDEYYSDGWDVADTGIGSTNEYQQMAGALDPDVALDILGDPNRNMDSILQIYGDDSWDNLPAFKIGDKWYGNPALGMPGKMGSGWSTT
jgi:hypothetical protein